MRQIITKEKYMTFEEQFAADMKKNRMEWNLERARAGDRFSIYQLKCLLSNESPCTDETDHN
jgi:hypothetical protein